MLGYPPTPPLPPRPLAADQPTHLLPPLDAQNFLDTLAFQYLNRPPPLGESSGRLHLRAWSHEAQIGLSARLVSAKPPPPRAPR